MTNYANGARRERELIALLEKQGYACQRAAGSHGAFDVIAWNGKQHLHIQVKPVGRWDHDDLQRMLASPLPPRTELWLVEYERGAWWRWVWKRGAWRRSGPWKRSVL